MAVILMVYQGPCCMYHCSTYNVLMYQILNYTWSSLWFLKNGEGLGKCKYILILQWSSAFHSIIIYIAFYCIIAMYCMYCLMYLVKSLIRGLIFHQILQQRPITFWFQNYYSFPKKSHNLLSSGGSISSKIC